MASAQDIKPPLTLEELATLFRLDVDDLPGDTVTDVNWKNDDTGLLWSNQEICRYAEEAQIEFCYRNPIHDHNTQLTLTHIAVTAATQKSNISTKILAIDRCKWVDDNADEVVLQKRTAAWMDAHQPEWDLEGALGTAGTPEFYIEDMDNRSIWLYPVPDVSGDLHLTIQRLPFISFSWSRRHLDQPEIDPQHHLDLLDYMKYLAYMKKDAQTDDKDLSQKFLDSFTLKVGERPDARILRFRKQERNYPRRAAGQYF